MTVRMSVPLRKRYWNVTLPENTVIYDIVQISTRKYMVIMKHSASAVFQPVQEFPKLEKAKKFLEQYEPA